MNDEIVHNDNPVKPEVPNENKPVKAKVKVKAKSPCEDCKELKDSIHTVGKYRKALEYIETTVKPAVQERKARDQKRINKLTTGLILVSGTLMVFVIALFLILSSNKKGVKKTNVSTK